MRLLAALVALAATTQAAFHAKVISKDHGARCELVLLEPAVHRLLRNETIIERQHAVCHHDHGKDGDSHDHDHDHDHDELLHFYGIHEAAVFDAIKSQCKTLLDKQPVTTASDEVFEFVRSGPSANRIDVVFLGDGYRDVEKQRYLDDMRRMIDDMFEGDTFGSWLPLFNIWGVFRASRESGIGVNGRPRDTAFGLYRDGTTLRGITTSKPQDARDACSRTGPSGCDFPSIISNDEFYGGRGGEFTVSTRSLTSGTMVLRHEMGHNFIQVGEEYDGGATYRGVNSWPNLQVPWRHWLTDQSVYPPVAQQSAIRVQDYAWFDLAAGAYRIPFTSTGDYRRWFLRFTVSGCERDGVFRVALDGRDLGWTSSGTVDRSFWSMGELRGLSAGPHELVFTSLVPPATGAPIRQLCSVTLHEYMMEPEFHWDGNYVGAYNTYRLGNVFAGYRPTNELCLMRNMTSEEFCPVCIEGMWMQFLSKMSLLDDVTVTQTAGQTTVTLHVVPLAQFRDPSGPQVPGERYVVQWYRNGVLQPQFNNQFTFTASTSSLVGSWRAFLEFVTPEVRSDPNNLLKFNKQFEIAA